MPPPLPTIDDLRAKPKPAATAPATQNAKPAAAPIAKPVIRPAGTPSAKPMPAPPLPPPHVAAGQGQPQKNPNPGAPPRSQPAGNKTGSDHQQARRTARRRNAAPPAGQVAANDDAPTIGGLIYALEQKPSHRPFTFAAVVSAIWLVLGALFGWALMAPQVAAADGFLSLFATPAALTVLATLLIPIAAFWAVATLIWRSQELKLMSSAMTEVAVRLAEPDKMAEHSVASLGQSVRRQVSFMNDAVERALGRAGELEAMVHAEMGSLERSYSDNETRIRGLINELSGERHALLNTSGQINGTLKELGTEVPALIEKLSGQQIKLASIIEGAGQNLTALESTIDRSTNRLESQLGTRTEALQNVLGTSTDKLQTVLNDYTGALDAVMSSRSEQMSLSFSHYVDSLDGSIEQRTETLQTVFEEYARALDATLSNRAVTIESTLADRNKQIQGTLASGSKQIDATLAGHATQIETTLSDRTKQIETTLTDRTKQIETTLAERSGQMDSVLLGRVQMIDATVAKHTVTLDESLLDRTKALDDAFTQRLVLFDESIRRSTMAIDGAVGEKARVITDAMESQAQQLSDTLGRQANQIDETLMHGINAVRRTSESITKQSLKAIEGLANQSDMLKNVSESMLQKIADVTGRFEHQGHSIMKAAGSLERANSKIDMTLQQRQSELSKSLDHVTGKSEELDRLMLGYSSSLEGSLNEAEERAKALTDEFAKKAEQRSRQVLENIEQMNEATSSDTERRLQDLSGRFTDASKQMSEQMSSLSTNFNDTSHQMREQTAKAAAELESEQKRLRQQLSALPDATRESARTMRGALREQLQALEQLSTLSARQVSERDVVAPLAAETPPAAPLTAEDRPAPPQAASGAAASGAADIAAPSVSLSEPGEVTKKPAEPALSPQPAPQPAPQAAGPAPAATDEERAKALNSIGEALALRARPKPADAAPAQRAPAAPAQPGSEAPLQPAPAATAQPAPEGRPQPVPAATAQPIPEARPQPLPAVAAQPFGEARLQRTDRIEPVLHPARPGSGGGWSVGDLLARASSDDMPGPMPEPAPAAPARGLDIHLIARALDTATANALWLRLRDGQRGIMGRAVYTNEGQVTFDEICGRYKVESGFHVTVDRYLNDFEEAMRNAEQSGGDAAAIQQTLISEAGRVYLFLAHVAGRLS